MGQPSTHYFFTVHCAWKSISIMNNFPQELYAYSKFNDCASFVEYNRPLSVRGALATVHDREAHKTLQGGQCPIQCLIKPYPIDRSKYICCTASCQTSTWCNDQLWLAHGSWLVCSVWIILVAHNMKSPTSLTSMASKSNSFCRE